MSKRRQTGISSIGLLLLLAVIGFGVYVAIRLVPVYIDNWQISQSMQTVAHRADAATMSGSQLRTALKREFEVGYVSHMDLADDLTIRTGASGGRLMVYDYTVHLSLIGNVSLLVHFVDRQRVPGS